MTPTRPVRRRPGPGQCLDDSSEDPTNPLPGTPSAGWRIPAAWIGSGAFAAAAVAVVLAWPPGGVLVAAAVGGALVWLGRGLAAVLVTLVAICCAAAAGIEVTAVVLPGQVWQLAWVAPLGLAALVGALAVMRATGLHREPTGSVHAALLDLVAGATSLSLALALARPLGQLAQRALSALLGSEDNAAWVNLLVTLHGSGGRTAITRSTLITFGPTVATYLAVIRHTAGGIPGVALDGMAVTEDLLRAEALLVVGVPAVAALLARRTLGRRSLPLALVTWGVTTALLAATSLTLLMYGFLSTVLALLIGLTAVAVLCAARRPATATGWALVAVTAGTLVYGTGAAWIAVVPMAALGMAMFGASAVAAVIPFRDRAAMIATAICLAVLCGELLALLQQYRWVTAPIGSADLLSATGGTPAATTPVLVLALVLLGLGWMVSGSGLGADIIWRQGHRSAVLLLVAYLLVVLLLDGYVTRQAPHYGSVKLTFVVVAAAVPLALIEVMRSPGVVRQGIQTALGLSLVTLLTFAVQQGPLYTAVANRWPHAVSAPVWQAAVTTHARTGSRMLCLSTALVPAQDPNKDLSYLCSRWAASLTGLDDATALTWRFAALSRTSTAAAVSAVEALGTTPVDFVVIGPAAAWKDPRAWWAPLTRLPQAHILLAGPSALQPTPTPR